MMRQRFEKIYQEIRRWLSAGGTAFQSEVKTELILPPEE